MKKTKLMSKPIKTKKTFLVDITGVVIAEDEWDNTTIHISRDGEWCELSFDKEDIVETIEDKANE